VARILSVFPGRVPLLAVIALHVLPAGLFAIVHGSVLYRLRGALVFAFLCLGIGNIFENLGVATGFPFGHYYFTGVMGPKVFNVPILLGGAYLGIGYASWTLALLILGEKRNRLAGASVLTMPLVASFIMVAWDFSTDPVWSTVVGCWVWRDGGPYFGVPVSNFFGWYLTVYVIYQMFALYLQRQAMASEPLPPSFWRVTVLFYAVCAAGNVLLAIPSHGGSVVVDPAGAQWKVGDITSACALAAIFTMGAFAAMAWARTGKPAFAADLRG
jgi:putative membrane protein